MLVGATYVQVTVRTDDPSKVNFDWCEMKDFSDEYAHNIEDIE